MVVERCAVASDGAPSSNSNVPSRLSTLSGVEIEAQACLAGNRHCSSPCVPCTRDVEPSVDSREVAAPSMGVGGPRPPHTDRMKWACQPRRWHLVVPPAPCPSIGLSLAATDVPFDLAEAKLAATVAAARHRGERSGHRTAERRRTCLSRPWSRPPATGRRRSSRVGRGRSASVRLGRSRRARRRPRRAPALHRGGDAPSRAGPSRGVRRVVRARGLRLVNACPSPRWRSGRARASTGSGARRFARCGQSCLLPTCLQSFPATSQPARRLRSQAGKSRPSPLAAGGRRAG